MTDHVGDKTKQPEKCQQLGSYKMACPNLRETGGGFSGERYNCDVCGESFFLDYEEMK